MELQSIPTESLKTLVVECRDTVALVCERIAIDDQLSRELNALVSSADLLTSFASLANNRPEVASVILQAAIATLVNTQSEFAINAELNRRSAFN